MISDSAFANGLSAAEKDPEPGKIGKRPMSSEKR